MEIKFKMSPLRKWLAMRLVKGLLDDIRTRLSGLSKEQMQAVASILCEKYKIKGLDPKVADEIIFNSMDLALQTTKALVEIADSKIKTGD